MGEFRCQIVITHGSFAELIKSGHAGGRARKKKQTSQMRHVRLQSVAEFRALPLYRSSHRRCSVKMVFLQISQKFTGKHLCQSLFF